MGGVRTALYNYLFARQHGGDFILRIEDTDSQRFVPGAEKYILDSLAWCGIRIDEGVAEGGPHAPYRQSERREIYLKYAQQLVESGHAYYALTRRRSSPRSGPRPNRGARRSPITTRYGAGWPRRSRCRPRKCAGEWKPANRGSYAS